MVKNKTTDKDERDHHANPFERIAPARGFPGASGYGLVSSGFGSPPVHVSLGRSAGGASRGRSARIALTMTKCLTFRASLSSIARIAP